MNKLKLPNVTLVAVSSIKIAETIQALEKSMRNIDFGEALLISHEKPENLPLGITFKKCAHLNNINLYNKFMVYELAEYISTEFVLVIQYDGYVLNPDQWRNEFLNYDYIGSPWPKKSNHFIDKDTCVRVGNGGFSLRSKRMLNILNELNLPFTDNGTGFYNEDGIICVYYRKQLENAGIKFAPVEVAAKFAHEFDCPESVYRPFGFHKYKYTSFFSPFKNLPRKIKKVLKL